MIVDQHTGLNNDVKETVGAIVAKDIRKAEVFKKYGIDFCCGGKKSLQEACEAAQVDVAEVNAALQKATTAPARQVANFNRWEADFLADYIYNQHHLYYYEEAPVLSDLMTKVTQRHSAQHPELLQVQQLFQQLQQELSTHFLKEERVLFPFIKALVKAKRTVDFSELQSLPSINQPVQMMEMDHEAAGELLAALKNATNNFTPPSDSCNSFQLLYKKLQDLEADLHQHVHLENNILFPKALSLEKELQPILP